MYPEKTKSVGTDCEAVQRKTRHLKCHSKIKNKSIFYGNCFEKNSFVNRRRFPSLQKVMYERGAFSAMSQWRVKSMREIQPAAPALQCTIAYLHPREFSVTHEGYFSQCPSATAGASPPRQRNSIRVLFRKKTMDSPTFSKRSSLSPWNYSAEINK